MSRISKLYTDEFGWITKVIRNKEMELKDDGGIVCTYDEAKIASKYKPLFYSDGICYPDDFRTAWKILRSRGYNGKEAVQLLDSELYKLRDKIKSIHIKDEHIHKFEPNLSGGIPIHEFEEVPGLVLDAATQDDLDRANRIAVTTNIFPETCTTIKPYCYCTPPDSHPWLRLAERMDGRDEWGMCLRYKGELIQFETVKLEKPIGIIGVTIHFSRRRSHWFWREVERPVFAALRARGIKEVHAYTRIDRPDWIINLKRNYRKIKVSRTQKNSPFTLIFPTNEVFSGWPKRRTAGEGWSWESGSLIVREGTEADFPLINDYVNANYKEGSGMKRAIERMIDWWWNLDKAALILGFENDELTHMRIIRERGVTKSVAGMPSLVSAVSADFIDGMKAWQKAVGYIKNTIFVPGGTVSHPLMQRAIKLAKDGGAVEKKTHERFDDTYLELEWDS